MKDVAKITQLIPEKREKALTEFMKGIYGKFFLQSDALWKLLFS